MLTTLVGKRNNKVMEVSFAIRKSEYGDVTEKIAEMYINNAKRALKEAEYVIFWNSRSLLDIKDLTPKYFVDMLNK